MPQRPGSHYSVHERAVSTCRLTRKAPRVGAFCWRLGVFALAILVFILLAQEVRAGGTVSTCDEAHFLDALVGGGTITFSCSGTITLATTPLEGISITNGVTIDGTGQIVTINGGGTRRVFNIGTGGALTIVNMTISNGRVTGAGGYGGGIFNGGSLVVRGATFSDNQASQDGGAIYSNSPVTITESSFNGNVATNGGGIEVFNTTAMIANSTFYSNTALHGGAIDTYQFDGTLTLAVINSTFSGNSAGVGSGGGIRNNGGMITLKNSIVANSPTGGNCVGAIGDGGGNLRWPDSDATCPGTAGDPKLGVLANNGGPTQTMALQAGSAAIDAADDAICAASAVNNLDQRGTVRPQALHCDSGAFEYVEPLQPGPTYTVNSTAAGTDGNCGVSHCTIREAITAANADGVESTVELASSATYTLTTPDNEVNGLPLITTPITINAHGSTISRSTAGGTPTFRLMRIYMGVVTLNGVTLSNGEVSGSGGALLNNRGVVTITNSIISHNRADYGGGVVGMNTDGYLYIVGSTFVGNHANMGGGALANRSSNVVASGSTFKDNVADGGAGVGTGGAFQGEWSGPTTFTNCTFSGNLANGASDDGGGAIMLYSGTVMLLNSTVANNMSASKGGGLSRMGGTLTLENTLVAGNTASSAPDISGPVATSGYNLIGKIDGSTGITDGISHDMAGTTSVPLDARLAPLASNSGPTLTHALVAASPALEMGNGATCPSVDQRGIARPAPLGTACDIGAFESNLPPAPLIGIAHAPTIVWAGQPVTVTFSITNSTIIDYTGVAFTDTLPANIRVADPARVSNGCGGVVSAGPGSGVISLSGGTLAHGAQCTVTVNIWGSIAGTYAHATGPVSSSEAGAGRPSNPASFLVNGRTYLPMVRR